MSVEIVPSISGVGGTDIVFRNTGRTVASGIKASVDGTEFQPRDGEDRISPQLAKVLSKGFDLAPNARERFYWHIAASSEGGAPAHGAMGASDAGTIRVTYEWKRDGWWRRAKKFVSEVRYDLELFDITPAPMHGKEASKGANNRELHNIGLALRALNEHVGGLR